MIFVCISVLLGMAVFGFVVLRSPRFYRLGVLSFCGLALLSVFVVSYMGPRLALAHFKAVGGFYSQELALFLGSVHRVGIFFYAVMGLSVVFFGLIGLRLISLQGPKLESSRDS